MPLTQDQGFVELTLTFFSLRKQPLSVASFTADMNTLLTQLPPKQIKTKVQVCLLGLICPPLEDLLEVCKRHQVEHAICMVGPVHILSITQFRTLVPEAGISGRDKKLHPTVFCGMQLFIPAWDTCFWHQSPQIMSLFRHSQWNSWQVKYTKASTQMTEFRIFCLMANPSYMIMSVPSQGEVYTFMLKI